MASIMFYLLSLILITATLLCIFQRNPVHAVLYLVLGFFSLAIMFYLLGAPLVAAWEVIVYAGAIMVLFLFIIMMLGLAPQDRPEGPGWQRWLPFVILMAAVLACTLVIIALDPAATAQGEPYSLGPQDFGEALFGKYALAVQVVSFQLLFAAVGAYNLGRIQRGKGKP
ncbi:MAG: NADH-quinone oxidoreductase subunit J [Deltaproteobacteria bacterium]|jgi:NADH-quinone oxidoreductase subunit J|nr:NADH-quinone oxidoreductase subunit J [Deltaproteobacteria bacterium]